MEDRLKLMPVELDHRDLENRKRKHESTKIQSNSHGLIVLIDADSITFDLIKSLLREIAKYGTISHYRRIYGDWTSTPLADWKIPLRQLRIQTIQRQNYTADETTINNSLAIFRDILGLLGSQNIDGFCIVPNHFSFPNLMSRVKQYGWVIYGFGETDKTSASFIQACDKFVNIALLNNHESGAS